MSATSFNEKPSLASLLLHGLVSGLICGGFFLLALRLIGDPWLEAGVLAGLGAFALGAFFMRERELGLQIRAAERETERIETRYELRLDGIYRAPVVHVATCDATNLLTERISLGLASLLQIKAETRTRGASLAELLQVPPTELERIVAAAQTEGEPFELHRIEARDSAGQSLPLKLTAYYLPDSHMVELVFQPQSKEGATKPNSGSAERDLERFQRGMYWRENRILELKEEVNELAHELGRPRRYKVDQSSSDTSLPLKDIASEEVKKEEEGTR